MKTISIEEAEKLVREGETYSAEELKKIQKERLHQLVDYVREESPYLRELYKDLPEDYSLEDLPITEKGKLLDNYNSWVTDRELTEDKVREYLKKDLHVED